MRCICTSFTRRHEALGAVGCTAAAARLSRVCEPSAGAQHHRGAPWVRVLVRRAFASPNRAAFASRPPLSAAAALPCRVLHAEPGSQCAALVVQLDHASQYATLCPNASGAASFALALHFPTAGSSRLGRVVASQPSVAGGAALSWHRFFDAAHMLPLSIDLRQGFTEHTAATVQAETPPVSIEPSSTHAVAGSYSTQVAAGCGCCTRCSSWIELEDWGDHSLPTFLALASRSAPTCQPPTPRPLAAPARTSTHKPGAGSCLLLSLCAACLLQALALAGVLCRHLAGTAAAGRQPQLATPADAASDSHEQAAAAASAAPAYRPRPPQMRDACTSPMVALLTSPFARSKAALADAAGAALQPIAEEQQAQQAQQAVAKAKQEVVHEHELVSEGEAGAKEGKQLGAHQDRRSTAPPPSDWTRYGAHPEVLLAHLLAVTLTCWSKQGWAAAHA